MAYPSKTDRNTVLSTAMNLLEKEGVDKLAIRSVAAALDLAPNALYRYFANLAALMEALADESRNRLLVSLQKAAAKKKPRQAIRGIAHAYVQFAREHPEIFSLTLMPSHSAGENAAHVRSWKFVLEQVSRVYGEKRSPEAAVVLWAFLHGITALEAAKVFGEQKPASSFKCGLDLWIGAAETQGDGRL